MWRGHPRGGRAPQRLSVDRLLSQSFTETQETVLILWAKVGHPGSEILPTGDLKQDVHVGIFSGLHDSR